MPEDSHFRRDCHCCLHCAWGTHGPQSLGSRRPTSGNQPPAGDDDEPLLAVPCRSGSGGTGAASGRGHRARAERWRRCPILDKKRSHRPSFLPAGSLLGVTVTTFVRSTRSTKTCPGKETTYFQTCHHLFPAWRRIASGMGMTSPGRSGPVPSHSTPGTSLCTGPLTGPTLTQPASNAFENKGGNVANSC